MGTLLSFSPRKEIRTSSPQNEMGVGSTVTQLVTKTLPIDIEKIRCADTGIATFLSKLLQEGVVNIALDEEELDIHSTLRVLTESGESWELTLAELMECMREKPTSTSHSDLKGYLKNIFGRVGVEVIFDDYSPNITGVTVLYIDESNFSILLNTAVVSQIEDGVCHFSIRTNLDSESVTAYPEEFKNPKEIPLFLLAIKYFIRTHNDRNTPYSSDSPIEILRYHNGIMYIIQTTYGQLYIQTMAKIYECTYQYKSLKNDRIALQVFYNEHVIRHLR